MSETFMNDVNNIVNEATAPATFNIMNVIRNRSYPSNDVDIFLDEQTAYEASIIQEKLNKHTAEDEDDSEIKKLQEKLDAIVAELEKSKYVVRVMGMSEGEREDLMNLALENFPMEYEENKNPFTGETTKVELESKDRDRFFTNIIWLSAIKKITSPDGSVQEKFTIEDITELRRSLPIAASAAINESIEKVRVASAVFMSKVNEDFLQKR